jgi:hypothetical protein
MQSMKSPRTVKGLMTVAALLLATPAIAGAPVAIIEDIAAPSTKLQVMDYLEQGQSFALNAGEKITISYFNSCSVEKIEGGRVRVGLNKSAVTGGKMESENVPCGGGGIVLTERQSDQAAGIVFRSLEFSDKEAIKVYAVSPLFVFSNPAKELVIERVDGGTKEKRTLKIDGKQLDLAKLGIKLAQGGRYTATAGTSKSEFIVAETATGSTRSVISRLIGL